MQYEWRKKEQKNIIKYTEYWLNIYYESAKYQKYKNLWRF